MSLLWVESPQCHLDFCTQTFFLTLLLWWLLWIKVQKLKESGYYFAILIFLKFLCLYRNMWNLSSVFLGGDWQRPRLCFCKAVTALLGKKKCFIERRRSGVFSTASFRLVAVGVIDEATVCCLIWWNNYSWSWKQLDSLERRSRNNDDSWSRAFKPRHGFTEMLGQTELLSAAWCIQSSLLLLNKTTKVVSAQVIHSFIYQTH